MTVRFSCVAVIMLGVGLTALLAGCPNSSMLDASGEYEGTMAAWITSTDCDMRMSLIQVPLLPDPFGNSIVGTVTFDLMCISDAAQVGLDGLPELTIPLIGGWSTESTGTIELSVDTSLLQLPFTVAFECVGIGTDENSDGKMDAFTGDYSLSVTIPAADSGGADIPLEIGNTFAVYPTNTTY